MSEMENKRDRLLEVVELGAADTELFGRAFFPRAFRNVAPAMHREMDSLLDSTDRFVFLEVFRGGAKTTRFRVYAAKRIAYNLSKTILFVSKSQGHAAKNLRWLRRAIVKDERTGERTDFAKVFGLRPGSKWNDEELQIIHGTDDDVIWVTGLGVTGSVRGLNFDDFRPDLILCDDLVDEEIAGSPDSNKKLRSLVSGALKHSLAPAVDNPFAKMVVAQTPIAIGDLSETLRNDPEFRGVRFGCWTKETEDLPIHLRKSAWEERFPTADLQKQYHAAVARNDLSIFSREMEVRVISEEQAKFKPEWLRFFGEGQVEPEPPHHQMWIVMTIDPVPPPSPQQIAKGLTDKDFEAIAVVGKWQGKFFVLEISENRGHDPSWTVSEFVRLASRWRPKKIMVESVAYQRTLAWLLREKMRSMGRYWPIQEVTDKRSKVFRILDGLKGPAADGALFVRPEQSTFIDQFSRYAAVAHDDVIEAVAVACGELQGHFEVGDELPPDEDEAHIPELKYRRGAP